MWIVIGYVVVELQREFSLERCNKPWQSSRFAQANEGMNDHTLTPSPKVNVETVLGIGFVARGTEREGEP
jgi:hypothetical protein